MAKSPAQAELFLSHDDFAERLGREFAIILLPIIDKTMPLDRCREVADRLGLLASKRAKEQGRTTEISKPRPCAGCDTPVEGTAPAVLCGACAAGTRSAGSDG